MSLKDLEDMLQSGETQAADRPIVVVVDDDALVRRSLSTVLTDKYEVRTCSDGLEGVRAVDDSTSVVILDVRMPSHDGFWVCKHLRKKAPDVPIIFYSAYQDIKDPYEVINEYHPFGYVVKGDALSELLVLVANAVKYSERLRSRRETVERLRDARKQLRQVQVDSGRPSDRPPSSRPSERTRARSSRPPPSRAPSSRPPSSQAPSSRPPANRASSWPASERPPPSGRKRTPRS